MRYWRGLAEVTSNSAVGKAIVVVSQSTVLTRFAPATFSNAHARVLTMNQFIYSVGMTGPNAKTDFGAVNGTSVDMASIGTFADLIGDRNRPGNQHGAYLRMGSVPKSTRHLAARSEHTRQPTQSAIFNVPGPATPPDFTLPSRVGFFATQAACADFTPLGQRLHEESTIMATQRNFGD